MGFDGIIPEFLFKFKVDISMGGAMILRVGYTNITACEASKKFWRLYPNMAFWGTTTAKRHTESLSDCVTQEYASYTDPSFLGL